MESSDKLCMEGLCQSFKFDEENVAHTNIKYDRHVDLNAKKSKLATGEAKAADREKNLNFGQISERNLVCVMGIPAVLADGDILGRKGYFGQFGKILKVSVVKNRGQSPQCLSAESGFSVYVTFYKAEDAIRCRQSMNGFILNGKILKAFLGKKEPNNLEPTLTADPDCLCLLEEGTCGDNYAKENAWKGNRSVNQLPTHFGRKRVFEAEREKKRADGCESDGDNFSWSENESKQGHSGVQNIKSPWDSFKRQKFDARKVKDEGSLFHETEASSVESASASTVGTGAVSHVQSSADHNANEFASLGDKILKMDASDYEFMMVQKKFHKGLGLLASYATIKCIYKNCHRSTSGQARLQAFKHQEETTKVFRGGSNVRYAWHGASKAGISIIILHGFGQPLIPKNGAMYGIGVYLAPESHSHVGAVYSDVDENGEQHMVLCRVIMGNMEQVEQGSGQFHPTSEDYDTGVDDLCNPRHYIVWSTHMNTHILPEYIVSFKLSPLWNDMIATLRGRHAAAKPTLTGKGMQHDVQMAECGPSPKITSSSTCIPTPDSVEQQAVEPRTSSRGPRSPWMSFPMLFIVMKAKLSEVQMSELQQKYLQFKAGRMPRDQLIKAVRSIAGDRLLSDSIRNMQAQHASFLGRVAGDPSFQPDRDFCSCTG